jgi:hypothetical protein
VGNFLVKAERTAAGIRVVDPRVERVDGPILDLDTTHFNRLPGCIGGEDQDLQLFFETALTLLKLRGGRRPAESAHPGRLTHA